MAAYNDDGQWRWRKQILVRGQRVRGSGTPNVNTKRAAEEDEAEWITKARGGGPLRPGEVPTMKAIYQGYLAHVGMHRSPSLRKNRESAFKCHLLPWFGSMRLDQIGTVAIDRFKEAQKDLDDAPNTINGRLMTLTNFLRWAIARHYLTAMPKVEYFPRNPITKVEFLEPAALDAVLAATSGELRTMTLVAAHTGLRIGELLALRWSDVNLKTGKLTVQHNTYRGTDRPPKGKRERTVPLSRTARAALKEHQHLRGKLVFPDEDGNGVPYSTALYRLQHATGLRGWHVLRHTFGTRLSTLGVPLRAIMEWMGHASIKTTMIYAKYSPVLDSAIYVLDGAETWQPHANRAVDSLEAE